TEFDERIHRGQNVARELACVIRAAAGKGHARFEYHVATRCQKRWQPVLARLRIRRRIAALLGARMNRAWIHLNDQRITRALAVAGWHRDAREHRVAGAGCVTHIPRSAYVELRDVLIE